MDEYEFEEIGFFDALFGLVTQPGETTEVLLRQKRPKYIIRFFFLLFLTIFGPSLFYVWKYGAAVYTPTNIYSLILIVFFFMLCFVFFLGAFFFVIGVECSNTHLIACTVYSLTPLVAVFLLIYIFNYINTGNLSFASLLVQGAATKTDKFLRIIPYALLIAQLNVLVVLCHTMKYLGDMFLTTALAFTLCAIMPIMISLLIALQLANAALPGSKDVFYRLVSYMKILWNL